MHLLCVIPARLGSTRIHQKPLCLLNGEPLVRAVARRVRQMGLDAPLVVATDNRQVAEALRGEDVECVLTQGEFRTGTERVAWVAAQPPYREAEIVLNVQGDQPFLPAEAAWGAVAKVEAGDRVGTAAAWLAPEACDNPARVKVVVGEDGRALRFSRAYPDSRGWGAGVAVLQHIGVYAYSRDALERWVRLPATPAERRERLEQLRPMAAGWTIRVARLDEPAPLAIDTTADLERAGAALGATR